MKTTSTHTERPERLIRRVEVESRTGLSKSVMYLLIARGEFPEPVRLGPRGTAWVESEVAQWIEQRIQARATRPRRGQSEPASA